MFFVYILKLSNNTYYHGFSTNLRERLNAHNDGKVSQTKQFRPVSLVFYSAFCIKQKAIDFEKYLKTGSGYSFRNRHLI